MAVFMNVLYMQVVLDECAPLHLALSYQQSQARRTDYASFAHGQRVGGQGFVEDGDEPQAVRR